mmetsp:Transcript_49696/g.118412  ORF Transcript_49696/g.118412 Transcript_49696/m.118412 type:complete len:119 (-) Transcript_49696:1215-1571(-)
MMGSLREMMATESAARMYDPRVVWHQDLIQPQGMPLQLDRSKRLQARWHCEQPQDWPHDGLGHDSQGCEAGEDDSDTAKVLDLTAQQHHSALDCSICGPREDSRPCATSMGPALAGDH